MSVDKSENPSSPNSKNDRNLPAQGKLLSFLHISPQAVIWVLIGLPVLYGVTDLVYGVAELINALTNFVEKASGLATDVTTQALGKKNGAAR